MTLQNQFERELLNIGDGGRGHGGCRMIRRAIFLAISSSGIRWLCRSINCGWRPTNLASADAAKLERIGKALAGRLTYLMEPIARLRSMRQACVVQLRSRSAATRRRWPQLLRAARSPRRRDRARAVSQRKRRRPSAKLRRPLRARCCSGWSATSARCWSNCAAIYFEAIAPLRALANRVGERRSHVFRSL